MNRRSFLTAAGISSISLKIAAHQTETRLHFERSFALLPSVSDEQNLQALTGHGQNVYATIWNKRLRGYTFTDNTLSGEPVWSWAPPPGHYMGLRVHPSGASLITMREASPQQGGVGSTLAELNFAGAIIRENRFPRGVIDYDILDEKLVSYWRDSIFDVRPLNNPGTPIHRTGSFFGNVRFASVLALDEKNTIVLDHETGRFVKANLETWRSSNSHIAAPEVAETVRMNAATSAKLNTTPAPADLRVSPGRPTAIICAAERRPAGTVLVMVSPVSLSMGALIMEFAPDGTVVAKRYAQLPDRSDSKYKIPIHITATADAFVLGYTDGYALSYHIE